VYYDTIDDGYIVGGDGTRRRQKRILKRCHDHAEREVKPHYSDNRYWTITGRNLVNEQSSQAEDDQESLLVDALRDVSDSNNTTKDEDIASATETREGAYKESDTIDRNETVESTTHYYQPIRLLAILTDDPSSGSKYLTQSQRRVLMEDTINPALYVWSQALHVVPVEKEGLTLDRGQLFDGESCGPGLVRVCVHNSIG
jgi:hypothetical protein